MITKTKHSREWRILLNPAFCGEIIRNAIKEYEKHDEKGLSFTLVFFILPLILHPDTYNKIQNRRQGQFFGWLDKQFLFNIDLDERIKLLKKVTLESISFLAFFNAIKITNGKIQTVDFDLYDDSQKYKPYMQKYQDKAIQVGRWLGQSPSLSTLYFMLGVRP